MTGRVYHAPTCDPGEKVEIGLNIVREGAMTMEFVGLRHVAIDVLALLAECEKECVKHQ